MPDPHVVLYVPGLEVGGAEMHTLILRAGLQGLGYRTSLIIYGRGRSDAMMVREGAQDAILIEGRAVTSLGSWSRLCAAFKVTKPDILLAIDPTSIITSALMRGVIRSPIIGILHATVPTPAWERRVPALKMLAHSLDCMVYVSDNQRTYWRTQGIRVQDRVIHNGIDVDYFQRNQNDCSARVPMGVGKAAYLIGLLGALRPEKNHAQLVDAVHRLRRAGIPAVCVFIGDGPSRRDIERYVIENGMQEHVIFVGEQVDVRPFLSALDVGVLCSTTESFPLSALETLAMGVPMVMSNVGGASEIIEHGRNGFLFAPGDTDMLVEYLTRLSNPRFRSNMQVAARASAVRFSTAAMIEKYDALLIEVLGR